MTLYSGKADGGPLHGKYIHHGTKAMALARRRSDMKVVTWFGPANEEIRVDEYRFTAGKWIWKEKT